jgi:hypothetical protein
LRCIHATATAYTSIGRRESGKLAALASRSYNFTMTMEQFRSTLQLRPFRPFTIRMADGRTFEIPHPDFAAQSPSGRTVIVFHEDDSYTLLDLLLMTEVDVHGSNGRTA